MTKKKSDKIPKLIKFPPKLFEEIEEYQEKNSHLTSFTTTVFELIRKGLKS